MMTDHGPQRRHSDPGSPKLATETTASRRSSVSDALPPRAHNVVQLIDGLLANNPFGPTPVRAAPEQTPVRATPEHTPIRAYDITSYRFRHVLATPEETPVLAIEKYTAVLAPEQTTVRATPEQTPVYDTPEHTLFHRTPEQTPVRATTEQTSVPLTSKTETTASRRFSESETQPPRPQNVVQRDDQQLVDKPFGPTPLLDTLRPSIEYYRQLLDEAYEDRARWQACWAEAVEERKVAEEMIVITPEVRHRATVTDAPPTLTVQATQTDAPPTSALTDALPTSACIVQATQTDVPPTSALTLAQATQTDAPPTSPLTVRATQTDAPPILTIQALASALATVTCELRSTQTDAPLTSALTLTHATQTDAPPTSPLTVPQTDAPPTSPLNLTQPKQTDTQTDAPPTITVEALASALETVTCELRTTQTDATPPTPTATVQAPTLPHHHGPATTQEEPALVVDSPTSASSDPEVPETHALQSPDRLKRNTQFRNRRRCPIVGCEVETYKLAQHLQTSKAPGHLLDRNSAQALAKTVGRPCRIQAGRLRHTCQVEGCGAFVDNLTNHMRTVHVASRRSTPATPTTPATPDTQATPQLPALPHNTTQLHALSPNTTRPNTRPCPSTEIVMSGKTDFNVEVRLYFDYIQSEPGGLKSVKNAKQHSRVVQSFWSHTGIQGISAFNKNSLLAYCRTRYDLVEARQIAPGTYRSELTSLMAFMRYTTLRGLDIPNVSGLIQMLKNISLSLKFFVAERRATVPETDFTTAVIHPLAKSYFQLSPYVTDVITLLNGPGKPAEKTLTKAKGIVMVLISIGTGSGISALVNLTAQMVTDAKLIQQPGKPDCRVIGVPAHTTPTAQGAAELAVSPFVWQIVVDYMRHTDATGNTLVFRRATGLGYQQSVSNADYHLSHAWKASGTEDKYGPYTTTRARESITTTARDKKRVAAETVASLGEVQRRRSSEAKKPRLADQEVSEEDMSEESLEEEEVVRQLTLITFPLLESCSSPEDILSHLPAKAAFMHKVYTKSRNYLTSKELCKTSYHVIFTALQERFLARYGNTLDEWYKIAFDIGKRDDTDRDFIHALLVSDRIAKALGCKIRGRDHIQFDIPYEDISEDAASIPPSPPQELGETDMDTYHQMANVRRDILATRKAAAAEKSADLRNQAFEERARQRHEDQICHQKRIPWSPEEVAVITELFASEIASKSKRKVHLEDIINRPGVSQLVRTRTYYQIRDKIQHLREKNTKQ